MAAVLQAQQAAEEDRLRAGWYSLLARLLAAPADDEVIAVLRGLGDDETELGAALRALKAAAGAASPSAVEQEFFDLFVGVGQGELVPTAPTI